MYINTAGVGFIEHGAVSAAGARPGDAILVSGTMGDHHAAILGERMSIETDIKSDCAPLTEIVRNLTEGGIHLHTMRDITRGGLATVLKELAEASERQFVIDEELIPVTLKVRDFCGMLGLDPLYMGNEGKLAAIVPEEEAERALSIMQHSKYGENACRIGTVTDGPKGQLIMRTEIGGERDLDILQGEGLPRIC
jgi:hydrogenase expression/formation protein HypE